MKNFVDFEINVKSYKKANEEQLFVEGIANKSIVDRGNDLIPPEAWNLKNFQALPMIFFNHDRNQPVGKATELTVKDDGLHIKAKLSNSDDPGIKRVRDLVKEGILKAFSVGFDPGEMAEEEIDGKQVNVIKSAELLEVSIVSLPMNQESLFDVSTKTLGEMDEAKFKQLKADAPAEDEEEDEEEAEKETPKEQDDLKDDPDSRKEEPAVAITNNEGDTDNVNGSALFDLQKAQVTLLGALIEEVKKLNGLMTKAFVQPEPDSKTETVEQPKAEPMEDDEEEEETEEEKTLQLIEAKELQLIDLKREQCDKLFKKLGL